MGPAIETLQQKIHGYDRKESRKGIIEWPHDRGGWPEPDTVRKRT